MSDTVLNHARDIAELLGLPVETGQGDPVVGLLSAIRSYLSSGGGGSGGGNAGYADLDCRKLEKKTAYADTSWDWWRPESDGGGHWAWDFATGILRFNGFINNPQSPVVFESSAILGGGPGFVTSGGSRVGNRLIAAWDGGGRGKGSIRTYYTVGKSSSVFTALDEIATHEWAQSFLSSEQGVPRGSVATTAGLALIADPKKGDWTYVAENRTIYAYNGLTWTGLFTLDAGQTPPDETTLEVSDGVLQIKDTGVSDEKIGKRTLTNEDGSETLVPVAEKALTEWLQGIRDNLKGLFESKVGKLTGDTDCDHVYVKHADGTQGYQKLWAEPEANAIPSRDEDGVLYAQAGNSDNSVVIKSQLDAETEARNEAIAEAQLATHTWLPAVQTKALLPEPSKPDELNYLCRVIADDTPANNGVWEWIAGSGEWMYFSDNQDWVDETELAAEIGSHNTDGTAHSTLFAAKAPLESPALTGTPTAPTADKTVDTGQIATAAYVKSVVADFIPLIKMPAWTEFTSPAASGQRHVHGAVLRALRYGTPDA